MTEARVSLASLPTEIANHICRLLEQCEVSRLSRTTKSIYCLIRPILYRNPSIQSFVSLTRFQRTILKATWMGKVDPKRSIHGGIDEIRLLEVILDPSRDAAKNGSQPTAVLISRMIKAIARQCPSLEITLKFLHCRCGAAPISVFEIEEFPCVKKLVLYLGAHDPEETHVRRRDRCVPNAKFFRPLVSGLSFPNLKDLEVRHIWANIPPPNASIDLTVQSAVNHTYGICRDAIGYPGGLEKLETIVLESPPELNSAVLMQLVGNPKAAASNLTTLDLRFCQIDRGTIAQLLYHAPPKLKHLAILCNNESVQFQGDPDQAILAGRFQPPGVAHGTRNARKPSEVHLCPLIRQYSTRLERLDYGAAYVCRRLFFDEDEIRLLQESGINTKIGGSNGMEIESKKLDMHAIQNTIHMYRQREKATVRDDDRVQGAAQDHNATVPLSDYRVSSEAIAHTEGTKSKVQREVANLLEDEEAQRQRLVNRSSAKWFRRIIAWEGLCRLDDTWAEMKLAADMEEIGIEWVLANKVLQVASQHTNGELSIALDYNHALEESFRPESR